MNYRLDIDWKELYKYRIKALTSFKIEYDAIFLDFIPDIVVENIISGGWYLSSNKTNKIIYILNNKTKQVPLKDPNQKLVMAYNNHILTNQLITSVNVEPIYKYILHYDSTSFIITAYNAYLDDKLFYIDNLDNCLKSYDYSNTGQTEILYKLIDFSKPNIVSNTKFIYVSYRHKTEIEIIRTDRKTNENKTMSITSPLIVYRVHSIIVNNLLYLRPYIVGGKTNYIEIDVERKTYKETNGRIPNLLLQKVYSLADIDKYIFKLTGGVYPNQLLFSVDEREAVMVIAGFFYTLSY